MSQVKFSSKIGKREAATLKALSERTRISQAKLLEEAVHLLEAHYAHDVIDAAFRREVDAVIKEDLSALRRLAK
ncbi:MAG: ribbon-helix-helix domain-containing protein [Elusimicrobia bacterium]|nr:ribbon-helix-helix domain-containing protein [Elusimicrobiota bacterium]